METLKVLPDIARLSDYVVRILGQNPGKFTLQGTNTYLVGRRPPFILVDTGEGRNTYPPLLETALRSSHAETSGALKLNCMVSDIVITHRHHDHYGGLPDVLRLLRELYDEHKVDSEEYIKPRIHKYPSPSESDNSTYKSAFQSVVSSLPAGSYHAATAGSPIHELEDSQRLEAADGSVSLEVLHTPGHTPDSICLLLLRSDNKGDIHPDVLFSADSVLGQGTAVFEDLRTYIHSLQRVLALHEDPSANASFNEIYPGHGPVVDHGQALIATYIKHRLDREAQIVDILSSSPPGEEGRHDESPSTWTVWAIVTQIYKDYPENLWLPAAHGVGLHLKKLEGDGRARCLGGEGVDQRWALSSRL